MKKLKMLLLSLLMVGMMSVSTLNAVVVQEAKLSDIKVNGTTLSDFSADKDSYELEVDPGEVAFTNTAADENDIVKVSVSRTGNENDVTQGGNEIIADGETITYTVTVTDASDDTKVSTYTVVVKGKTTTTTPDPTPTEPEKTEEELFNELVKSLNEAIKASEELKDILVITGSSYDTKSIYFEAIETLEDGTEVIGSFYVEVNEEVNDVASVLFAVADKLESEDVYVTINPKDGNIITKTALEIMKEVGEVFGFYGHSDRYVYWQIDGSKVTTDDAQINLSVLVGDEVNADLKKSIESLLVDKTKSLVLDFAHSGKLPKGTNIEMYVGDKFKDGDVLSLFYYNPTTKKLEEKVKNIKVVEEGYITFDIEHCSSYVLAKTTNNAATGTINVILYGSIMVMAVAGIVVLLKKKNN